MNTLFVGKRDSFRFLWVGQMAANLGDVLYIVSLIKLIYDVTGSILYMSLIPFVNTFSAFLSSFFAPLVIQKYRLKAILVFSQLTKTVFLLTLVLIAVFFQKAMLFPVFVLVGLISFMDGWASPARNALIPGIVTKDKLIKVNSLLAISDQVIQLISWPIGSIVLVALGGSVVLWFTFILFVFSTLILAMIQSESSISQHATSSNKKILKEGWSLIWHSKQLRTICAMDILGALANGVWIAAIIYVYVEDVLKKPESWWGFINGSFFAGMLVGGILILHFSAHLEKKLGITMLLATLSLAVITFVFGTSALPWLSLLASFLFGIPQMAFEVAETTILQKSARDHLLAKVYSARGTLLFASFGISSILMGWLTELYGVKMVFIIAACLLATSFILAFINRRALFLDVTIQAGSVEKGIDQ